MNRRMAELSWPEIQGRFDAGRRTVVVAFGATEQHGPHLPLATDTLLGDELARRVAERLDALIAPTVAIGCSSHHSAFPGTLSLSDGTFAAVVGDLVSSFARSGFHRAVLLPSHGGNFGPLARAVDALEATATLRVDALTDLSVLASLPVFGEQHEGVPPGEGGLHAGEWETSLLLASDPQLVHMERAVAGYVGDPEEALSAVFDVGVHELSENGVIGDPARADRERGSRYWEHIVDLVIAQLTNNDDS
jgi:creatinine amidohydrolase